MRENGIARLPKVCQHLPGSARPWFINSGDVVVYRKTHGEDARESILSLAIPCTLQCAWPPSAVLESFIACLMAPTYIA